jgi:hypothetical protein
LNKYLLSTFYIPDFVLLFGSISWGKKKKPLPLGSLHSGREIQMTNNNTMNIILEWISSLI